MQSRSYLQNGIVLEIMSLYIFSISPNKHVDEVHVFLPADNKHKYFLQIECTTLGVLARHAQSIQNKLIIYLQYLKENVKDEVDFFPLGKQFFKVK